MIAHLFFTLTLGAALGSLLPHLTAKEAEAQRSQATCTRAHSCGAAELGSAPRLLGPHISVALALLLQGLGFFKLTCNSIQSELGPLKGFESHKLMIQITQKRKLKRAVKQKRIWTSLQVTVAPRSCESCTCRLQWTDRHVGRRAAEALGPDPCVSGWTQFPLGQGTGDSWLSVRPNKMQTRARKRLAHGHGSPTWVRN